MDKNEKYVKGTRRKNTQPLNKEPADVPVQHRKQKYEQVPIPLDGGYGWVIVAAVAYCNFCAVRYSIIT